MQWSEIRNHYPEQWLLVEALAAHSTQGQRVLDQLAVVDAFPDSGRALARYAQFHKESPNREMYVFHTSRENLNITERNWMGVRTNLRRSKSGAVSIRVHDVRDFDVDPGTYRIRSCHANLVGCNNADDDWYVVQFWPASLAAPMALDWWEERV